MRYKPTIHYISSIRRGPTRALIVIASVILLMGYLVYFGPARPKDDPTVVFIFVTLFFGTIGFVQFRQLRKTADNLAASAYVLAEEGISVESPGASFIIPYHDIRGVTIKRYLLNKEIVQILLKGQGGLAALPCLEMQESFIAVLRQRVGAIPFNEKRSLLM